MKFSNIAVYPGTFDPITHGHMDIILRTSKFVDKLIIAVAVETGSKVPLFSAEKRLEMVYETLRQHPELEGKIEAKIFDGLLVNFAKENHSNIIIRGLRAVSDFEYEFQMSCMNSKLSPEIETFFLPATEKTHFVSSNLVKQVAKLGGDISEFVTESVKQEVLKHFKGI